MHKVQPRHSNRRGLPITVAGMLVLDGCIVTLDAICFWQPTAQTIRQWG